MPIRAFLRHHWPAITITVTAAAIACAAFVMLGNMPPHRIVMATGPEGSAYYEDGKRYRAALAKAGVEVQLVSTAGSVETAALLRDPRSGVSVGLMQGGVVGAANTAGLESLGTVAYEPLWWFHRPENQGVGADGLRGRKIVIGPPGSGTRALSLELIKRTGMERQIGELLALGPREAAEKLKAGEIDVAFMMNSWDAPVIQQLLADEHVALSGFPHADAFVALYPFLNKVIVPRGDGSGAGSTAGGRDPDCNQDQPGGAPGPASGPSVPAARRGDGDPFETEHFQSRQRISRRRGDQHAPEQRSGALLQIGPAVPARLFSILDGRAARQAHYPTHSDPGRALPDDTIFAGSL